jgi:hypothetical protein
MDGMDVTEEEAPSPAFPAPDIALLVFEPVGP